MGVINGKSILALICAIQFCFILVLIQNKNHDECMVQLADSNSRLEEISALQNVREQEIAAEQVARMEASIEMKEQHISLSVEQCCSCCGNPK